MEFVKGRDLQETESDEFILGKATAKLHEIKDYDRKCSFHSEEQKKIYKEWFTDYTFK